MGTLRPAFRVQHVQGSLSPGQSVGTLVEGVDYTLDFKDLRRAWCTLVQTRSTGNGESGGSQPQPPQEAQLYIIDPGNIANEIELRRVVSGINDVQYSLQVYEYIGEPGGPNEVVVQDGRTTLSSGSSFTFVVRHDVSKSRMLPIVAAQSVISSLGNNTNGAWWTTDTVAIGPDTIVSVERGPGWSPSSYVSTYTLEFTGSNWNTLQRIDYTGNMAGPFSGSVGSYDYFSRTVSLSRTIDRRYCFLHVQNRVPSGDTGLDDGGRLARFNTSSNTSLVFQACTNDQTNVADRVTVAWVVEHLDSNTLAESEQTILEYDARSPDTSQLLETETVGSSIASPLEPRLSIEGLCSASNGSGNAHPRGQVDAHLYSFSSFRRVDLRRANSGQETRLAFQLFRWPDDQYEELDGDVDGIATTGGFLGRVRPIVGVASSGEAAVDGLLNRVRPVEAGVTGHAVIEAGLSVSVAISGAVAGQGVVGDVDMSRDVSMNGAISSHATVDTSLSVLVAVSGTVNAASLLGATLSGDFPGDITLEIAGTSRMASGGWGNSPWGSTWGGSGSALSSESIPFSERWDIFDLSGIRQPDDLERLLVYTEVAAFGAGSQFFIPSFNIASGGSFSTSTAVVQIDRPVDENFTLFYRLKFDALPPNFADVTLEHVFLGGWSGQGLVAGFFFSQIGVQYTGELTLDGSQDIVVERDQQDLPGSQDWFSEGEELVIQVVVNGSTGLTYLFVTPSADFDAGNSKLRAILAVREVQASVSDAAHISVRGSVLNPSQLELLDYRMSSKTLVTDVPPVAIAGEDQAVNQCSVVLLDGSASFDPEGNELTYEWRLIDAPQGSVFSVEGHDGRSIPDPSPTGFTDVFYSDTLASVDVVEPIEAGDVLTFSGGSFTIVDKGSDPDFFVRVEFAQLPDDLLGAPFKLLRNTAISGADTVKPAFYPDQLGFYVFDLRVFDGSLSSSPFGLDRSQVLINVVENALPRGCSVDASFMFDNLLSFWKLVEDRDRLETFFEGVSRVAATELYTLWQYEYSKSLRDIQRQFTRRWLHYDPLLPEPIPELTELKYVWSGFRSNPISKTGVSIFNRVLVVTSPRLAEPIEFVLRGSGQVEPGRYARELEVLLQEQLDPTATASVIWMRAQARASLEAAVFPVSVVGRTLSVQVDDQTVQAAVIAAPMSAKDFVQEIAAQLTSAVVQLEGNELVIGSKTAGPNSRVRIDASSNLLQPNGGPLTFSTNQVEPAARILLQSREPLTLTSLSNAPGFVFPKVNTTLGGLNGQVVSERVLRAEQSLLDYALEEDDLLVIDRQAFRIVRVVDDPRDPEPFQRVVVKDPLPAVGSVVEWLIPGWVQSQLLNFYAGLIDRGDVVDFEAVFLNELGERDTVLVETRAFSVAEASFRRLAVDTVALASSLTGREEAVRLARVLRRRFLPIDEAAVDIPILSDVIAVEDADAVLHRNVDFFLESFRGQNAIRFSSGVGSDFGDVWEGERPPERLWAEYTFFNNEELIEANFGTAIGLTRDRVPSSVDYLSAVRGVWYALYNGPTMSNLRIAVQIFLGLPFAEVEGVIEEIRTDFLSQRSRILVRDVENAEIVRSYVYPRVLDLEVNPATGESYRVGDVVAEFAPLVTGVTLVDYVKDPEWFRGILNQGIFSEVQKYHTFLVQVDLDAFDLQLLGFAQQFIAGVKPVYTDPLYVVLFRVSEAGDEIDVIDDVRYDVRLQLQDTPCCGQGIDRVYDQPFPGGAEYGKTTRNQYDSDFDPNNVDPTYPTPDAQIFWGYDREYLCPVDDVQILRCENYVAEVPRYDSIWRYDVGPLSQIVGSTSGTQVFPHTFSLGAVPQDMTLTTLFLQLNGPTTTGVTEGDWVVEVLLDSVVQASYPFTIGYQVYVPPGILQLHISIPQNVDIAENINVAATTGQVLELRVRAVGGGPQAPGWNDFNYAVSYIDDQWTFDDGPYTGKLCTVTEAL